MNKLILSLIAISLTGVTVWGINHFLLAETATESLTEKGKVQQTDQSKQALIENIVMHQLKKQRKNLSQEERMASLKERREERKKQRTQRQQEKRVTTKPSTPMTEAEIVEFEQRRETINAERHEYALNNLESEDDSVRLDAIIELDSKNPEDLKLILQLLKTDPDPAVRTEAAEALSFGDHPSTISSLITALSDAEPKVVATAIEALSWYDDDKQVIEAVKYLKNHSDSRVRDEAEALLDFAE